jgi:hypothetical protein
MRRTPFMCLALALVAHAAPLAAQDESTPVEIHSYGGWAYGRTSANILLAGRPEGDTRSATMALNLFKRIDEKLSIHGQLFVDSFEQTNVGLDYAFADYKVDDHLSFHVGQVKQPFGIYTEVFDVGTLRPFIDLPQSVYGPIGFTGESYTGLGLTANKELGDWTVTYDAYVGGATLQKLVTPELYLRGNTVPVQSVSDEVEQQSTRNVIGGRVVFQTPVRGLTFGGSSYTGILDEAAANRRTVVALQASYRSDRLTVESEAAHQDEVNDERANGGYLLAAYRVTPEWQVGAQYDVLTNRFAAVSSASAPSLEVHRDAAVVISRWFSRSLALKAEYHLVRGNRFALPLPSELASTIAANELHTTTHLVQLGAQYAY